MRGGIEGERQTMALDESSLGPFVVPSFVNLLFGTHYL